MGVAAVAVLSIAAAPSPANAFAVRHAPGVLQDQATIEHVWHRGYPHRRYYRYGYRAPIRITAPMRIRTPTPIAHTTAATTTMADRTCRLARSDLETGDASRCVMMRAPECIRPAMRRA